MSESVYNKITDQWKQMSLKENTEDTIMTLKGLYYIAMNRAKKNDANIAGEN